MSAAKLNSNSSKNSSCRLKLSRPSSVKSSKARIANPRRVIASRRIPQIVSTNRQADSLAFSNNNKTTNPRNTTKSTFTVKREQSHEKPIDYCKNCGDAVQSSTTLKRVGSDGRSIQTTTNTRSYTKSTKSTKSNRTGNSRFSNSNSERNPEPVKQYYKNENYLAESTEGISNGIKKISLDTIKEVSERHPSDSIFEIYSDDSDEEITFFNIDDQDSLKELKEFREKNYFECHSAKSRIKNKGSATSLQGHRCVYRFYLNDRLFPVPLSSDHNDQVRCVECLLPMELNVDDATSINGTIQAKVSIGKKNQDIMLLLPVKEPLIITEKRREDKPKDREVVFFGVINLDGFGNSMFNSTLPGNSLALKYQKGYQEFQNKVDYSYRDLDKADVIVI